MQQWIFSIRSRPFFLLFAAFVILSILVYTEITNTFDNYILSHVQNLAGNPFLDLTMQTFTEIGNVFYMAPFSFVLLIIKRTRRIGLTLIILLVVSTILTGYLKCGVNRERPDLEFTGIPYLLEIESDTFALFCSGYSASYPSGHAARAAAFSFVLGYVISERFPRGCYLLWIYPFLTSLSRVYILQHFPMDVIGGTILGVLLASIISKQLKLNLIFDKLKS